LKDIGNYKLLQVHEALQRLDRAVSQLEAASNAVAPTLSLAREAPLLKSRLEEITAQHAALKTSAEDVAARLDQAIARLADVVGSDSGQP
jgi:seryl-tRNA synthetase